MHHSSAHSPPSIAPRKLSCCGPEGNGASAGGEGVQRIPERQPRRLRPDAAVILGDDAVAAEVILQVPVIRHGPLP